ncbi:hypothetical protein [Ramlibacter sp.]|uniref:hypothetical protein n=1 Tax=Ramlibacter sp. TaxID=1917967 RepID=UPI003D0F5902
MLDAGADASGLRLIEIAGMPWRSGSRVVNARVDNGAGRQRVVVCWIMAALPEMLFWSEFWRVRTPV